MIPVRNSSSVNTWVIKAAALNANPSSPSSWSEQRRLDILEIVSYLHISDVQLDPSPEGDKTVLLVASKRFVFLRMTQSLEFTRKLNSLPYKGPAAAKTGQCIGTLHSCTFRKARTSSVHHTDIATSPRSPLILCLARCRSRPRQAQTQANPNPTHSANRRRVALELKAPQSSHPCAR